MRNGAALASRPAVVRAVRGYFFVTLTWALPTLPAASVAVTWIVCTPEATFFVLQV